MHCEKSRFTPINRRHHYRRCGLVVCGNCSARKFLLPHISSKPIRVCDTCYEKLSSGAANPTDQVTPEEKAATMAAARRNQGNLSGSSLSRKQSENLTESGSSGDEKSDDEDGGNPIGTEPTFYETVKSPDEPMEE